MGKQIFAGQMGPAALASAMGHSAGAPLDENMGRGATARHGQRMRDKENRNEEPRCTA